MPVSLSPRHKNISISNTRRLIIKNEEATKESTTYNEKGKRHVRPEVSNW